MKETYTVIVVAHGSLKSRRGITQTAITTHNTTSGQQIRMTLPKEHGLDDLYAARDLIAQAIVQTEEKRTP